MKLQEAALDWAGDDALIMGCGTVPAAQFIESCERFKDINFVSIFLFFERVIDLQHIF
jgi:hypothetical protein